jgi:hypothetical protein
MWRNPQAACLLATKRVFRKLKEIGYVFGYLTHVLSIYGMA